MKKVAVIGTVGVPAKYGGFETLVENLIGECCSEDVDYTVFCSGKAYPTRLKTYKTPGSNTCRCMQTVCKVFRMISGR